MVTPDSLRRKAITLNALMEGFEHTYLEYADRSLEKETPEDARKRDGAVLAFYHIRDLLDAIAVDMEQLAGHMEVCNAVFAAAYVRKETEGSEAK